MISHFSNIKLTNFREKKPNIGVIFVKKNTFKFHKTLSKTTLVRALQFKN